MRILHISNVDVAVPDGSAEHVLGLAQGLSELGHVAVVLAPTSGQSVKQGGFELRAVQSQKSAFARAIAVFRSIRRIVEDVEPDAIYLRSFPLDYLLVMRQLREFDVPVIVELNTMAREQHLVLGHRLRAPILAWFEVKTLRAADAWAPLTDEIAEYAHELTGDPEKAWRLALNAFDAGDIPEFDVRAAIRERHGVRSTDTVLVMAGFGHPWHGVDRAIEAMEHLDDTHHLWLVGARNEQDHSIVGRFARPRTAPRIKVFDSMPYDDLVELFTGADVGLGSLAFDRHALTQAQPIKVALYLALGLSVIINYRDVRFPDPLPFVVRPIDSTTEAFVEALNELKPLTPSLRQQASQHAAHKLSWRKAARRTVGLIEEVRTARLVTTDPG